MSEVTRALLAFFGAGLLTLYVLVLWSRRPRRASPAARASYDTRYALYQAQLHERLLTVALDERIAVLYFTDLVAHDGTKCAGLYRLPTASVIRHIRIDEKYRGNPWVLAHELGHYFAIRQRGDRSEGGADQEAHRMIDRLLDVERRDFLRPYAEIYLGVCR